MGVPWIDLGFMPTIRQVETGGDDSDAEPDPFPVDLAPAHALDVLNASRRRRAVRYAADAGGRFTRSALIGHLTELEYAERGDDDWPKSRFRRSVHSSFLQAHEAKLIDAGVLRNAPKNTYQPGPNATGMAALLDDIEARCAAPDAE